MRHSERRTGARVFVACGSAGLWELALDAAAESWPIAAADAIRDRIGSRDNIVVDPDVLGGIRVDIGDDVIDGTVASRLDDARRKIAG